MNKIIAEQLRLVNFQLPQYDLTTTELIIPKQGSKPTGMQLGCWYIVELANYILNPPPNFNLHDNWNHGVKPIYKWMLAQPIKFAGKMVQIRGYYYNIDTKQTSPDTWEGWCPISSITLLLEVPNGQPSN